ncbi:hypothetical protein QN277_011534 [Acacia crassicarpa]|uniref:SMP-30/Gluconolactonase/LRE-like region domain-containing protein n=1 Tax=Acacia crassicarpa TaxID=499986 RepID=A0AAE1MZ86_9FABA|nr:hypothetical protein QN277_011534 [Acacia crassicarpa]
MSMSIITFIIFFLLVFGLSLFFPTSFLFHPKPHKIHFRFPNLYPEGLAWDPLTHQFYVGSLRQRIIAAVTDTGVSETFIFDSSLPENVTFLGLTVDSPNRRLLAAVHAMEPLPPFNALAAYDLTSRQRIFLSILPDDGGGSGRPTANDVSVDDEGNAYVTNSGGNYIWKVNYRGEASIFSRSPQFTAHPVDRNAPHSYCGLNGIAYVSKGYFLVVQSNTGKMFKVDANDGAARLVKVKEDLMVADDVVLADDAVLVVSPVNKLWYLRSEDSWGEGDLYDEIDLDLERFPTSLVVGGGKRTYVVYGHVEEGMMGISGREIFSIEEVRSRKSESGNSQIWRVLVLIGMGLALTFIWRLQKLWLVNKGKKVN